MRGDQRRKEERSVYRRSSTLDPSCLEPHTGTTRWGMGLWRDVDAAKMYVLDVDKKRAWELRDKIQRLFNPRFHSLHLHTVRT